MALSINKKMTKGEILKEIASHAAEYPALADLYEADGEEIDSPLTIAQLLERAPAIVEEADAAAGEDRELTAAERAAEFKAAVDEMPGAVLVPVYEAYYRSEKRRRGVRRPEEVFIVTLAPGRLGSNSIEIDDVRGRLREPDKVWSAPNPVPAGRTISEVPEWAYAEIHEAVESGELRMFEDREALEAFDWSPRRQHVDGGILDRDGGSVEIALTKEENGFAAPAILHKAVGKFTRPEQSCAWSVLNEVVKGQAPLPENDKHVSGDVNDVSQEELQLVERRIRDCLDRPDKYTSMRVDRGSFDPIEFFTSLVKYEMKGMNPKRPGTGSPQGDTRRQVMLLIREICDEKGLQVVNNYVRRKPQRVFEEGVVPTQPLRGNVYEVA